MRSRLPLGFNPHQLEFSDGRIYFYAPDEPNGFLANYSSHAIRVEGQVYKSVEHYFQSRKFSDIEIAARIRNAPTPSAAKELARQHKNQRVSNWSQIKETVMYEGIKAKFCQHSFLRELLLSSGGAEIVEWTKEDFYWGCGADNSGRNRMGFLLMKLRSELNLLE